MKIETKHGIVLDQNLIDKIELRDKLRKGGEYNLADNIRKEIGELGIRINDKDDGVELLRRKRRWVGNKFYYI